MKELTRKLLLTLICTLLGGAAAELHAGHSHADSGSLPTEELKRLNKAIKAADMYLHDKTVRLDSMSRSYRELPASDHIARWQTAMNLAEGYLPLRADSALKYSQLALECARTDHDWPQELQSRVVRVNALSTCGIFTKALAEFNEIDPSQVPANLKVPYWMAGRKLYGYMRLYVEGEQEFYKQYTDL
ncbi:MAG: hypothetical protein K2H21_05290, partial [Muribaculaceae bacterium]|nr:hypothetical protein [Muribaculaceae bacterium]